MPREPYSNDEVIENIFKELYENPPTKNDTPKTYYGVFKGKELGSTPIILLVKLAENSKHKIRFVIHEDDKSGTLAITLAASLRK